MNNLELFMEKLKSGLAKVPKAIADDVIQYYIEYIDDARHAGVSDDMILAKTGSVEQIIRATLDEISITAAQNRPSPILLLKTSRRILGKGAIRAAKSTSLALLSMIPLLAAIVFYLAAFVFLLVVPASAVILTNNIMAHPGLSQTDIWGQIGLIVAIVAFFLMLAWLMRICGNGLTRLTLRIFEKIAVHNKPTRVRETSQPKAKKTMTKAVVIFLLIFFCFGLILAGVNGLLQNYFMLWNSVKPNDSRNMKQEITSGPIHNISMTGLNSNVTVLPANGNTASFSYEQVPDYFQLNWKQDADSLTLTESSNGKLPLIDLLAFHEGTTRLTIYLPLDNQGLNLEIQSNGGHVEVNVPCRQVGVSTYSGNIRLHSKDGQYNGSLVSTTGQVTIIRD
jgi:uncharacterized membrane protein